MLPPTASRSGSGRVLSVALMLLLWSVVGCAWFGSGVRPDIPLTQRLTVAVLDFGMGIEITSLSAVKSVDEELSLEQEASLVKQAVRDIRTEARRLIYHRLEAGQQYTLIPLEEVDASVEGLGLDPGEPPKAAQVARLRSKLGADMVVGGLVQDYGKVRWQWLAAGMLTDTTAESIVIGLVTAWNPVAMAANVGFNLLTSTPIWFGGGYLFGVAFRPVRVEAWAVETQDGEEVWDSMEVAVYARERLKELSEENRRKKEAQLQVNLNKVMEALGDSLLDSGLTITTLQERRKEYVDPYDRTRGF